MMLFEKEKYIGDDVLRVFSIILLLIFAPIFALKFAVDSFPENPLPPKFINSSGQITEFYSGNDFGKWHEKHQDIEIISESFSGRGNGYIFMIIYKEIKKTKEIELKFKDVELTDNIFKPC